MARRESPLEATGWLIAVGEPGQVPEKFRTCGIFSPVESAGKSRICRKGIASTPRSFPSRELLLPMRGTRSHPAPDLLRPNNRCENRQVRRGVVWRKNIGKDHSGTRSDPMMSIPQPTACQEFSGGQMGAVFLSQTFTRSHFPGRHRPGTGGNRVDSRQGQMRNVAVPDFGNLKIFIFRSLFLA